MRLVLEAGRLGYYIVWLAILFSCEVFHGVRIMWRQWADGTLHLS